MSDSSGAAPLGVAEARARFSELIDRVVSGERFVVSRRGRPVVALVSPGDLTDRTAPPLGLAAVAGSLGDWDDLPIHASRRRARDRPVPELD